MVTWQSSKYFQDISRILQVTMSHREISLQTYRTARYILCVRFIGCNVYFWLVGILDIFRYSWKKKICCNITEYLLFPIILLSALPCLARLFWLVPTLKSNWRLFPESSQIAFSSFQPRDKKLCLCNLPYQHLNAFFT